MSDASVPADIRELQDAFAAAERDAEALVAGLTEAEGSRRLAAGSWSVAECLSHLATGNSVYLRAMLDPADRARRQGRSRRRPAKPGFVGRLFVARLEPPPRWWSRMTAPRRIRPPAAVPPLAETFASFMAAQTGFRAFLRANHDLDLATIRFPNPFIRSAARNSSAGGHPGDHRRRDQPGLAPRETG